MLPVTAQVMIPLRAAAMLAAPIRRRREGGEAFRSCQRIRYQSSAKTATTPGRTNPSTTHSGEHEAGVQCDAGQTSDERAVQANELQVGSEFEFDLFRNELRVPLAHDVFDQRRKLIGRS